MMTTATKPAAQQLEPFSHWAPHYEDSKGQDHGRIPVGQGGKATRAGRNIIWCQQLLIIPEGTYVGQRLTMADFMKEDFHAIYDNPEGTRRAILSRGRKNAKAVSIDTPVPTPDGWRTIADVQPGDFVFGSDGLPVLVKNVSEVFTDKPCYAVAFSDGSSIVASEDHLWTTEHRYRPWDGGAKGRSRTSTITTAQIAASVRYPRPDGGVESNHKLRCAPALHMTPVFLTVAPYVLGAWLGNGHSEGAGITVCDADLVHHREALREGGEVIEHRVNRDNGASKLYIRGGLVGQLRSLGLLRNKHIPEVYFGAGLAQRWALLQGLMDTDGNVNRCGGLTTARCSYSSSRYRLACDVWRLARSLGLKASIISSEAKIYDKSYGLCWKVEFAAASDSPVFRLERKQSLLPKQLGKRSGTITITSCERVETVPTKCLMVDAPDHLFLVGHGCIPTHNTTEAAMIVLLHLCGREQAPNSQLYSAAQSRDQAALLFSLAAKMVRLNPRLDGIISIRESAKTLSCPSLGTMYRALSADASTNFGLSPSLIVHDEAGQIKGSKGAGSSLYEALETATAAQPNPLSIVISTQAPTDGDLLSILIDDAIGGHDPRTVVRLSTAPEDLDPFSEEAIRAANPGFDIFMNQREVLAMAADAKRMPAREAEFRNLVLNQRVESSNPFVTRSVWQACGTDVLSVAGVPCYAGLDLSSVSDLTAYVKIGQPIGNRVWQVHPTFWLPGIGLADKARTDRVPYDVWAANGLLQTTPGNSISYEFVADYLKTEFAKFNIMKLAFDRWNMKHLKPWLERAGFSSQFIDSHFVEFGQGTQSMSPALRDLEQVIIERQIAHGNHPVLAMCAACAVVEGKDDANRKLSKNRSTGRIDGMVALAMAMGVALQTRPVDVRLMIM